MVAFFIPTERCAMLVLLNFRLLKLEDLFQNDTFSASAHLTAA